VRRSTYAWNRWARALARLGICWGCQRTPWIP